MPAGGAYLANQRVIETLDINAKINLLRKENDDTEGNSSDVHNLKTTEKVRGGNLLNGSETNPLIIEDGVASEKEIASIHSKTEGFFY